MAMNNMIRYYCEFAVNPLPEKEYVEKLANRMLKENLMWYEPNIGYIKANDYLVVSCLENVSEKRKIETLKYVVLRLIRQHQIETMKRALV